MKMKRPARGDQRDGFDVSSCGRGSAAAGGGLTLQRVEDGEQVHEGEADGAPGKQSEAPGHSQEEGQADDAPKVPQHLGNHATLARPQRLASVCQRMSWRTFLQEEPPQSQQVSSVI